MKNTHPLKRFPNQYAIDSIASYQYELAENYRDYEQLLGALKNDLNRLGFTPTDDNQRWMLNIGNDYLMNPTLFEHAPLNCMCVILSEVFKENDLDDLSVRLPASALKPLLTRFNEFKQH